MYTNQTVLTVYTVSLATLVLYECTQPDSVNSVHCVIGHIGPVRMYTNQTVLTVYTVSLATLVLCECTPTRQC